MNPEFKKHKKFVSQLIKSKEERQEKSEPEDILLHMFGVSNYHTLTMDRFATHESKNLIEVTGFSAWRKAALHNHEYTFESARTTHQGNEIEYIRQDGQTKNMLNFSGYNYLGLSHHPDVKEAAKSAIDHYGIGAGSSPISSGTTKLHEDFSKELIDFFDVPDWGASLFSSGYAVNVGTLSAVLSPGHYALLDQSAHMSIVEGAQVSGANILFFEHNNMTHLEEQLQKLQKTQKRIIICTEGVYSADGDFGLISQIVQLAKKYGALTLVDEAHSILLTGTHGRGVCESQNVLNEIDFLVLTFSKGFGGIGGALMAKKDITDYVNWYARCRLFSCALDPGVTGGMRKALEIASSSEGEKERQRLHQNAQQLKALLSPNLHIGDTQSWIIPVIYGDETITLPLSDYLQDIGLEGSTMQYPAVPKGEARIRLFVTSKHTESNIKKASDLILSAAEKFNFKK